MIERVLVANRGEIAVRIVDACHRLGRQAVVAHSDPDAGSLAVSRADAAWPLGGTLAADTYLEIEGLITAARKSGCDAVHPGYGFLAERGDFARAVTAAGLTFIGPPADVIDTMGDKLAARKAAIAAGVPVVPGTTVELEDAAAIIRFGEEHGWPVAVKAAHGGGGRGMRVVHAPAEAADALAAAQREATAAFGRAEVYLERFLTRPRHVEVQIVADAHGQVAAVGERDCSIQRRYQKLIEEAPAPALSEAVRRGLADTAVELARAVGYRSAGTVEYLVEGEEFFFLEMNTRIQVEHPVTELVTGIDLVAEQILVAEGRPLSFDPTAVVTNGAAIEIRINAEDTTGGRFVPTPGTLVRWELPTGDGVRVDTGFVAGDVISPHYDNLIAKVSVWGPDRDTARHRAQAALAALQIEGVPTTAAAAAVILGHPDFAAVRHSTHWLEEHAVELFSGPDPADTSAGTGRSAEVDVGGRSYRIPRFPDGLAGGGGPEPVATAGGPAERGAGGRVRAVRKGSGRLMAPMQGTIINVAVGVGDTVQIGSALAVLEAMKMENTLMSDVDGTVAEVHIEVGASVSPGQLLVVVTTAEDGAR